MSTNPSDTNQQQSSKSASDTSWSSWFVSPSTLKERFQEFDDQQRIDRLSECRKLDKILHDCRKRNQPGKPKSRYTKNTITDKSNDDAIESVSIGVRNMKYFGWRGILKSSVASTSNEKDPSAQSEASDAPNKKEVVRDGPDLSIFHPNIQSSCAREEHAVWACRAIATGCGKDLAELKKCFDDVDNGSGELPPHVRVLTAPYTNYQGIVDSVSKDRVTTMKEQIPCHEIQRRLGSCVTEHGKQLLERKQQRERKQ